MNYVDVTCLLILLVYINNARRKGVFYMITSLFGKLLSIAASVFFCGSVTSILRQTPLFSFLKAKATEFLGFDEITEAQIGLNLDNINIRDSFYNSILANNNSEVYKLFGVTDFADYIASYIANILINIISITLVFFTVSVIIKTLFAANAVVTRLPVIKQVNGIINIAAGICQGVIIIWVLMIILMFFTLQGFFINIYEDLLASKFAVLLLKHNILANIIFEVMA